VPTVVVPLYDRNPTRGKPVVTILLIIACAVVYFGIQPHHTTVQDAEFTYAHAAIPCELLRDRPLSPTEIESNHCPSGENEPPVFPEKNVYLAVLYSMFLHGGLLHILGNMLFLWVFGNNVEDRMGKAGYLAFYLAAGVAATAAQVAIDPGSAIPMIGASGAIAGVMGAYLILWPDVRIYSLVFLGFFVFFRDLSAKWLLGIWFVLNFFTGNSGVAWMAHVGGFVFGMLVALVLKASRRPGTSLAH
jgi:membrane associated rhomboid family serine protease